MALDATNPADTPAAEPVDPNAPVADEGQSSDQPGAVPAPVAAPVSNEAVVSAAGDLPAGGDPAAGGSGDPTPPKPKTPPAKPGLLSRIAGGIKDIVVHPIDTAAAVGRGVVDAARGTVRTSVELSSQFLNATGLGKLIDGEDWDLAYKNLGAKGFGAQAAQPFDEANHTLFGPESARGGQQFVEGAAQFLTGFATLGRVLPGLSGIVGAVAKGAIVDAAVIDPYQANLAELAGSTKIPGISDLGKIASVTEDDGPLVARFKRAAVGTVAGAAAEGLIAGARMIRGLRVLSDAGASSEARTSAAQLVADQNQILKNIDSGTHVPDQPVVVRPNQDGTYSLDVNHDNASVQQLSASDVKTPDLGPLQSKVAPSGDTEHSWDLPNGDALIVRGQAVDGKFRVSFAGSTGGEGSVGAKTLLQARRQLLDATGTTDVTGFRISGANPGREAGAGAAAAPSGSSDAELMRLQNPDSNVRLPGEAPQGDISVRAPSDVQTVGRDSYNARWQAEQQAATLSQVVEGRARGIQPVSSFDTEATRQVARNIFDDAANTSLEDIAARVRNSRFNFSYMDAPDRTKQLLQSVTENFQEAFDAAQERPGIPKEESVQRAMDLAGVIKPENADEFVRQTGIDARSMDARVLASHAHLMNITDELGNLSGMMDQRPWDAVAHNEARTALARFLNVAADVAGANSGLGRALNALKFRGAEALKDLKFGTGTADAAAQDAAGIGTPTAEAADPIKMMLDGMSDQDIRDGARLSRLGDSPADIAETLQKHFLPHPEEAFQGARAQAEHNALPLGTKIAKGIQEAFYGTMLSNPATAAAVWLGTGTTTAVEQAVWYMAGIAKRDPAMLRQASDLLMGHLIYTKQSLIGMASAFKAGHNVIDPHPVIKAIPGVAGEVIRTFGARPIAAADEFWRVNNVLAYTRMQSLTIAREDAAKMGLQGDALDKFLKQRVETDVANSVDDAGRSIYPDARTFAQLPAFASKLQPGSLSGDLQDLIRNHPVLTPIAPFVKVTANSLHYSFVKGSPLGLLTKDWANATGEAAAQIGSRMAVGSTIWGAASLYAFTGNITGNGPTDPQLRQAWLKNNQPYSIRVGNEWFSYRRIEPISTPLSLAADMVSIVRDHSDDLDVTNDASHVYYGIVAAGISALTNKTYLSGMVDLMNAIGSKEPQQVKSYLERQAASVVPGIVSSFNSDPYMRQVSSMADAIKERVPGWSRTLPPKFDVFGDPRVMAPSRTQHALDPIAMQPIDDSHPEESTFVSLGKSFDPPPTVQRFGQISVNLHDPQWRNAQGGNLTPYERLMEIVRQDGLRQQVNDVITDPAFKDEGSGTAVFKGGRQSEQIRNVIQREYERANRQMLGEYPELSQQIKGLQRATKASRRSDQGGNDFLQSLTGGTPQQ